MAEVVPIPGYASTGKIRNPWGVLGLGIITAGVYLVFWWYFINRELRDMGRARQDPALGEGPANSALAFTFGGLLIGIPTVVTIVRTSGRIRHAQRATGSSEELNSGLAAILWIPTLTLGGVVYTQAQMNHALRAAARNGAGTPGHASTPPGGFIHPRDAPQQPQYQPTHGPSD